MSEFLDFLNNANKEALLKIEGMNKTLADRLISHRPFTSNEDSLKVKGMNIKLFSKLQSGFLEHKEDQVEEAVKQMEAEEKVEAEPAKKPHQGWRIALRVILILLIVIGLVYIAILYGVPYIRKTFLQPVENNNARLQEITNNQAEFNQQMADEITLLQTQVATLQARADAVDGSIAGLTTSLDTLNSLTGNLEAEMDYRIDLTRAIDYLSRARLYLSQSNNSLARADVLSARNLLSQLSSTAPALQVYALNETINNLDLALSNLPAYPAVAVYYVDISWQYLADGLNAVQPTVVPPASVPTEVTLTPAVSATPAP